MLGIHEIVVLIMVLVAGIGSLIERFSPAPSDGKRGENESGTPE